MLLLCLSSLMSCSQSNEEILLKVSNKISSIESVQYDSRMEAMEGGQLLFDDTTSIAFDFRNAVPNEIKYYFHSELGELIFNGKETFQSNASEKVIATSDDNSPDYVNNPLVHTLKPLRQILPILIQDNEVKIERERDTLINGTAYFNFSFLLNKKYIDWIKLEFVDWEIDSKHFLFVDKQDYLPFKIISPNGKNGSMSRTFENIELDYEFPKDLWNGESLPKDFAVFTLKEYFESLKNKMLDYVGKMVTDWELPLIANDSNINPSQLKGKVVLLEFWFKNCGGCKGAIPSLNKINTKFKNDNFEMYGIEFLERQSKEILQKYIKEQDIQFPILYKGKTVASKYGITGGPTFMVLDKTGKIIHLKSGYSEDHINEISGIIERNL